MLAASHHSTLYNPALLEYILLKKIYVAWFAVIHKTGLEEPKHTVKIMAPHILPDRAN